MTTPPDPEVSQRAEAFVRNEAGFAQVTTIDAAGYPVSRSMTAFLADGFEVHLVQRRLHRRLQQIARNPRLLVTWVGPPAEGAIPQRPHVFDLGRLPDRVVLIRGTAELMDDAWTWRIYSQQSARHRALGNNQAPARTEVEVADQLVGLRVHPYRVRLEGFAEGAASFDWQVNPALSVSHSSQNPPPHPPGVS